MKIYYEAADGEVFDNEMDCRVYEEGQQAIIDDLSVITFYIGSINDGVLTEWQPKDRSDFGEVNCGSDNIYFYVPSNEAGRAFVRAFNECVGRWEGDEVTPGWWIGEGDYDEWFNLDEEIDTLKNGRNILEEKRKG